MKRYNYKQFFIFCLIIMACIFNNTLDSRIFAEEQQQQKNNLDFAEKLIEFSSTGKFDLFDIAEEITLGIKNKPFSKEIQQRAYLLWGKLKKTQAAVERDIEKRSNLNNEAIDILTKFISENQDYIKLVDAKFEVAELLIVNIGMSNSNQLKLETDPMKKQSLLQQAESAFKKASEYLAEMISYYQKTLMDLTIEQSKREEIDNDISKASYFQGLNYYYWGILYDKTEENRKKYLQEAVKVLRSLILSIGEQIRAYEAANYLGICYMELAKYPDAKGYFQMAANLYSSTMKDPEKSDKEKKEIIEEQRDIIEQGYTRLAMLTNATKEYKESIKKIDELLKIFPNNQSDEWIQRGLLEKAMALFYTNAKDKALSMVQEIVDTSKDSSVRSSAKDIQNLFIKEGAGAGSTDIIIGTMRDLFAKNKLNETIKQGRALMNQLNNASEEVKIQYLPEVLYIIGESLKSQERYYEAAIIYGAVYLNPKYKDCQSTKKEAVAPLAAYGAASVYLKMNSLTGDESDRLKYKETLSYLVKNWPDSDPAKEVQYFQAKEKEDEGKFLEAADSYSKVLPSSKYYFESRFRTGQMYSFHIDKQLYPSYKEEQDPTKKISREDEISRYLSLASETLNNAIKLFGEKLKESLDEETKNKMLSFDINSRLFLSRIYLNEFNRKYAEVLTLLSSDIEKKYPNAISQIFSLKIEAFVRMGDFNSAESYLRSLKKIAEKENTPEILAFSLQSMALTYEKIADDIIAPASTTEEKEQRKIKIAEKKNKSPDEYQKFADVLQRSCECFSQWVEVRRKTITPDEVLTVANKLYQAAEEIEKDDFYTKAARLYERIVDKEFQNKLPASQEIWLIKWKMALTYRALGDKEKALNILEKLDEEQPKNIDIKKTLALTYETLGSLEKLAYWDKAKKKWAELGRLLKEQSEGWWEVKYHYVLIDVKAGLFKEAMHSINMIENAVNKDFDEDKFGYKTKFLELKETIGAKGIK